MTFFFRIFSLIFLTTLTLSNPGFAQESGRTILVLDASGSMWGQIGGKAKITIAQEVVNGLLGDIPADQELGLTVYGHRRKGDCSDIETLVEPGSNTRNAISRAVNAISPKGKTPLSAAVIAAAEALKYTEEKATVILVSDGKETCDFDPCEVGKRLEQAGVDFTAHVVGFDIAKPAVKAQLQCLAENTGGRFLSAANADELSKALEVVAAPEPPKEQSVTFTAIDGPGGPVITDGLVWQLLNVDKDTETLGPTVTDHLDLTLTPGKYMAEVSRMSDEATARLAVTITPDGQHSFIVELPPYSPLATLKAPEKALAGSQVAVTWTGPNEDKDYLSTANKDDRPSQTITYTYTKDGAPSSLQMPPTPGFYELRYIHDGTGKILATIQIEVLPLNVSIDLPETAIAGETLALKWKGPNYHLDYLSTAMLGDSGGQAQTYIHTNTGNPSGLEMPATPGEYEVRYVLNQNYTIVYSKTISVTEVTASLNIPKKAIAGETIVVDWKGPDYHLDYLSVAEIGSRGSQTINYIYTNNGAPSGLEMPANPGTYEVRYVMNQANTIIATEIIEVTSLETTVSAPASAVAGSTVTVEWAGPNYKLDYLSVAEIGSRGSQTINYVYANHGNPSALDMPATPGTYEIRYVLNQDNKVVATALIDVTPVRASLNAPASAAPEEEISISWNGPNYKLDYISIAEIGSRGSSTLSYAYTRNGEVAKLTMPKAPGEYEIRYVMRQGNTVIANKLITVR